tara:strand:- start:42 stop:1565 length:1524 start_codon:yes stop_codon:yes gene_type:complete
MTETENEGTLRKNINAAKMIVGTVKSTLGPLGRDKMMVDAAGNAVVTNDGATIMGELDVSHPGGKMIIEGAKTQESLCYDGTTSTVVLTGEMLGNSEGLLNKGLHPNIVCNGYNQAAAMAVSYLDSHLSVGEGETFHAKEGKYAFDLKDIARTAITGKTVDAALDDVAELCVQAVQKAGSAEKVRVLPLPGGSLRDSYLFNGAIVNKMPVLETELEKSQHIVLINTGLEPQKTDENVTVQLDMQGYSQFKSQGEEDLLSQAKMLVEYLPEGGMVFVRDGAADHVCTYLEKHEISVVRRLPESTMRALSSTLGVSVSQTPADVECSAKGMVYSERHYDVDYLFVQGEIDSDQSTLVLRGATTTTLDEIERGFDDALGVVSLVMNGDGVVAGGGSAYAAMAAHLRTQAASVEGRAQMAIEAFADALEIIPATIAENGGHDPLDCILNLRHKLQSHETEYGPNIEDGGVISMWNLGVLEPTSLVRQAVLSATEVTTAILKIDDMIAKRGE